MRVFNFLLILIPLWLTPVARAAEGVQVHAVADRTQVGMGDVIHLTISVTAQDSIQVEEPNLPPLSGFELINSSSSMETRSSYTNGHFLTTQARNFTYMLAVNQKGILTIPPVNVTVEGKTFRTEPIKISATNARAVPPQARGQARQPQEPQDEMDQMEDLFNQMLQRHLQPGAPGQPGQGPGQGQVQPPTNPNDAFMIMAETDKTKAYVGEQVTANFYLYTRGQIRDIDTLKYPDLKGFWKEELDMATRLNFDQVTINGMVYQRALLVSYALFPIKAGKSVVDPYKAKCTVLTPSAFGFGQPYVFSKSSKAIDIAVSELPAGAPPGFSGAVGRFKVSAQFEPPTGTVNQPVTLRIRFEGMGNAKLIELPKLDLPPSFEIYDQKSQAKYMKDGTSYKDFEVMIIPRQPGVFNIAPVASGVFAPDTGKYVSIATQPLNITVTGTATTPAPPVLPGVTAPDGKTPVNAEPALPALATEMEGPWLSAPVLYAITAVVYLLVFALLGYQAWRSLRRKPKRASLQLVMKRRLKSTRELMAKDEWRRVGVELTNAIYYVLGQISEQGGANQELMRMLEHTPPSLRSELSEPLQKLVTQCELLSFAPENMIGGLNEKAKLEALIKEFESVLNRAIELAEI